MGVTRVGAISVGWATVALAVTVGLSACGAADDSGAPAAPGESGQVSQGATTPEGSPIPPGAESLEITVTDGAGATTTWTLACDPVSGTHPEPADACAALEKNAKALKPVAPDAVCTMIYGGDNLASITGTWKGKPVHASFSLASGCEMARWAALEPLLPATGNTGSKSLTS